MDVSGSFLELSCVRLAVIPASSSLSDSRFIHLASFLTSIREIPLSHLPRRAAVPRILGHNTFTALPTSISSPSTPTLHRSRSATRDLPMRPSLRSSLSRPALSERRAELKLRGDVAATFRLRYDIILRDRTGALALRDKSEWDSFHTGKVWGVIGVVDCTAMPESSTEERKQTVLDAFDEFSDALEHFGDTVVRKLIIFVKPEDAGSDAFISNDPKQDTIAMDFSVGYVPERRKQEETRLEVKAQIAHFAGLLLNAIDRDCWKQRESPPTELLRSPIDDRYSADRQSKLAKRRPGRLEKVLADRLLLMGNPGEALVKYASAIEKAKANSDRLWLAGAMEGWSAAHVLTHVGAGGKVDDRALSDKLIEHYADIYKLYQKKRVAEPEAAAALRLAVFLGRWTKRRVDALDAAEHAATVGEGLRVQKRAALWEALARFSDQMGCRRKAALYLYRLGHLNASQSVWSSAVTLMIASERQLTRDGKKPWSDLNRKVLLTAAGHAESAGDSGIASRLLVEALVTPSHSHRSRQEEDEDLVKALSRSQVPTFLPAASDILYLSDISPMQIPGLSIRHREELGNGNKTDVERRDGPFIYNPFEARKRAKAAAVARRAVSWVCGEHAQVSVRLFNNTSADLVVNVIRVLVKVPKALQEDTETDNFLKCEEERKINRSLDEEEEDATAERTAMVTRVLKKSDKLAKTISESITIPSKEIRHNVVRHLTVIPKRTGPLYVVGLLVRLFNGALVIMQSTPINEDEVPPVNVICKLPRISIQSHSTEGGTIEIAQGRTPLTVYHGEIRRFHIDIENTGTEPIVWMKASVSSSRPDVLKVIGHDLLDNTILNDLEHRGSSKTFTVQILGTHPVDLEYNGTDERNSVESHSSLSFVSVVVEYEGLGSRGVIRESATHVKVLSKSALRIRRLDFFTGPRDLLYDDGTEEDSDYYIAIEVRNDVAAPSTVKVISAEQVQSMPAQSPGSKLIQHSAVSEEDYLIENGASARLVCNVPYQMVSDLRARLLEYSSGVVAQEDAASAYKIQWKLPALGRSGIMDISNEALCLAMGRAYEDVIGWGSHDKKENLGIRRIDATICWSILDKSASDAPGSKSSRNFVPSVEVGTFSLVELAIANRGASTLPNNTVVNIEVTQMNGQGFAELNSGVSIVGATEGVVIGPLAGHEDTFRHRLRVRITSTGIFQLEARLFEAESKNLDNTIRLGPGGACSASQHDSSANLSSSTTRGLEDDDKPSTPPSRTAAFMASIADAEIDSPATLGAPHHVAPESQVTLDQRLLQRVGIPKKKKQDGVRNQVVPNITHPKTVDSYPAMSSPSPPGPLLACAVLAFAVVEDYSGAKTFSTPFQ